MNLKKDVTLICVDGVNPDIAYKSIRFCNKDIKFDNVKLLSFSIPSEYNNDIEFIQIEKMSWEGYNDFIATKLNNYISTDFCLVVQTDGLIVNPDLWDDEFFNYDYIGAPWPDDDSWISLQNGKIRDFFILNRGKSRIGNGGFSLRSKKFLNESSKYESCEGYGEDAYLCNIHYDDMVSRGIKFPSVEIASKFSIENPIRELGYSWPNSDHNFNTSKSFGFHGVYVNDYDNIINSI